MDFWSLIDWLIEYLIGYLNIWSFKLIDQDHLIELVIEWLIDWLFGDGTIDTIDRWIDWLFGDGV